MKNLTIIAFLAAALLTGCSSTRVPASGGAAAGVTLARGGASAAESIAEAQRLYREALSRYVSDDLEAAHPLLVQARAELSDAAPDTDMLASEKRSLAARVDYFLSALESRRVPADAFVEAEPVRTDTLPVSVLEPSEPAGTCETPVETVTNERVQKWLDYFQGKGRKEMQRWLHRFPRYRPMIERILKEEGLPPELFYLSVIESGLNPNAYSKAHAAGMWQFISSRARIHGLRVDWWVDERRDPEKATRAACAYLKDLYGRFGSWELALAGYNSGEGRVERAQRKRPGCPDYWCLDLPRETENFVPKFMAAVMIGSDPETFGFEPPGHTDPLAYDTVEIRDAVDLQVIADATGATYDQVKELNPALRRWCTPPGDDSATLRLPCGTGERCLTVIASIPPEDRVTWRRHRVSRGETLSGIAKAYGTSISAITSVNDIRNPHSIRSGSYIVIPIGPGAGSVSDYTELPESIDYRVRKGDTISGIARRHGKSTRDVLRWNGLAWNSRIYPGDVITIRNM
ncbi:MAG: transglycosylase SLT domain-containing protein [Candidatus Eisenbacteria bacterium]|nr:transglycosylase SLT domain-containing protein [Candidatus Eisenbacteria bacterium]